MRAMAKEKTTLFLDEDVLRRTEAAAAGSGRDESEVVEDALRRYLGLEVVDQVWARNAEKSAAMRISSCSSKSSRRS
jgi:hypothetical protein